MSVESSISQISWILISARLLTSCVTLEMLSNPSLSFLSYKMETNTSSFVGVFDHKLLFLGCGILWDCAKLIMFRVRLIMSFICFSFSLIVILVC